MTITTRLTLFWTLLFLFAGSVASTLARAESVTIQRVIQVPANATLTYAVDGQTVQSMSLPVGEARITLQFTPLDFRGKIVNRHGRIIRRTP